MAFIRRFFRVKLGLVKIGVAVSHAHEIGGSHYLYRLCEEQTIAVNTTAAGGGNAALLASMH